MTSLGCALGASPTGAGFDAFAEAERHVEEGRALRAMEVLVRAESELAAKIGDLRVDRARVHALRRFVERVERMLPAIRRAITSPNELRHALELEVERACTLARVLIKGGWYALAAQTFAGVELLLGYLGPRAPQQFEWLRVRSSWAFAARQVDEARRTVSEYHATFRSIPLPDGEIERLIDELQGWLDVAPVRALIGDLGPSIAGKPGLERRFLAWEVASMFPVPWDEAVEGELEAHLRAPSVPLLEALVDRVIASVAAPRMALADTGLEPDLLEQLARAIRLLDRLAALGEERGTEGLALRARVTAHEQTLEVLAEICEEEQAATDPEEAARIRQIRETPPWSATARRARLEALRRAVGDTRGRRAKRRGPESLPVAKRDTRSFGPQDRDRGSLSLAQGDAPDPATVAVIVGDPIVGPKKAVALANAALHGEPDPAKLSVAKALVRRSVFRGPSRRASERVSVELARQWLEAAATSADRALARDAKEILAEAHERSGDDAGALLLYEELAGDFEEARDPDRWVRAVERCAMLAKRTGRLSAAGRAAQSGFRPGGRVEMPAEDLPIPDDPDQAGDQAERAVAVALRAKDPEVGDAWLRRALALYEKVPDGRRREDVIWERIADLWQTEADALLETAGDEDWHWVEELHHRAHEALVRAIEVNEELGDAQRVFELEGCVLQLLGTWLLRSDIAADEYFSLARTRFRSAIARGDLDHATTALLELRDDASALLADRSELGPDEEEARALSERFQELERDMTATLQAENARLGEPWWLERMERRRALLERRFERRGNDGDDVER